LNPAATFFLSSAWHIRALERIRVGPRRYCAPIGGIIAAHKNAEYWAADMQKRGNLMFEETYSKSQKAAFRIGELAQNLFGAINFNAFFNAPGYLIGMELALIAQVNDARR
jgi:hypothetical protein